MLFSRSIHRWVRRIARAVLPAPRQRVSREALTLAIRYASTPDEAQRLVDALGVKQAARVLMIVRQFGLDVRSVLEQL